MHLSVGDTKNFEGEYNFWGIDQSQSKIEIFEDSQYITTCAMWRKIKFSVDEGSDVTDISVGTDYADGALDLEIGQSLQMNLGYQVSFFAETENNEDPFERSYGNASYTTTDGMNDGALAPLMASLTSAISLLVLLAF